MSSTLVLLRHGESTWNRENRFTGWTDVPLTEQGMEEARKAAALIRDEGLDYDLVHSAAEAARPRPGCLRRATSKGNETLASNASPADQSHTSYLKRAIHTMVLTLEGLDRLWLPVVCHWRLNERHYGALQGLNEKEMTERGTARNR